MDGRYKRAIRFGIACNKPGQQSDIHAIQNDTPHQHLHDRQELSRPIREEREISTLLYPIRRKTGRKW